VVEPWAVGGQEMESMDYLVVMVCKVYKKA
jgi:hypothetical protein